jgi:hypothetical protein
LSSGARQVQGNWHSELPVFLRLPASRALTTNCR